MALKLTCINSHGFINGKQNGRLFGNSMKGRRNNIPDFDDLLFESRNREYGAYQLRKRYNSVVIGGLIIASLMGCAAVIIPFLLTPRNEQVVSGGGRYVQVQMDNLEPPREELYVPPAPPPPENTSAQDIVKYIPPEVVDTIVPFEKNQVTMDEVLAHSGEIRVENAGTGFGQDLLAGDGGADTGEPFFLVEVMPTFRGGDLNKFRDWVQKRTNYPQAAIDAKIKGTVFLTFIVEKDGSVSNVTVIKGVHPLIDNEAIKAISESPKWTPGLQRGQPVRVRYQIPLSFIF
jgi:protein TonB